MLGPGVSLHMLDYAETEGSSSGGFGPCRSHCYPQPDFEQRVPALMQEAGLTGAAEVDHRVKKGLGTLLTTARSRPWHDPAPGRGTVSSGERI